MITTHLEHSEDHLRLEEYFVPKVLWSSWWSQVLPSLSSNATFEEPPSLEAPGATPEATGCEGDDTWAAGSLEAVTEREGHSLVWTGTRMIVWGGETPTGEGPYPLNTAAAFDPALNAWIPISRRGAPSARSGHTAVWTGKEMLIWGGSTDATGARYDPVRDVWSPMAVLGWFKCIRASQ